jgi:ribosome biogenesis GTPase / thiamine phosphate phosphatase
MLPARGQMGRRNQVGPLGHGGQVGEGGSSWGADNPGSDAIVGPMKAAGAHPIPGIVIRIDTRQSHVDTASGVLLCVLRGSTEPNRNRSRRGKNLPREAGSRLAVGDQVLVTPADDGQGTIESVLPRRTKLSRRAAGPENREQIVAANVDQLVIVSSLADPALSLNLIDRYLVAADRGGLGAILCINKLDLGDPEAARAQLATYVALGYPVLFTSARTGSGIDALRNQLHAKTSVFTGKSGAGKSALLTAVEPGLELHSAPISAATGKGRHTTSYSSLLRLTGGGYVIDTPGIRAYTLWEVEAEDVAHHFPEIRAVAIGCRFSNCSHLHEPDCAVQAAAGDGRIDPRRYASYRRIRSGIDEDAAG